MDVIVGERPFRKVTVCATIRLILARRIAEIRPNFLADATVSTIMRGTLRQVDPRDPRELPQPPEEVSIILGYWRFQNYCYVCTSSLRIRPRSLPGNSAATGSSSR